MFAYLWNKSSTILSYYLLFIYIVVKVCIIIWLSFCWINWKINKVFILGRNYIGLVLCGNNNLDIIKFIFILFLNHKHTIAYKKDEAACHRPINWRSIFKINLTYLKSQRTTFGKTIFKPWFDINIYFFFLWKSQK